MKTLFIHIRWNPGTGYDVAEKIYQRFVEELQSPVSLHSISGDFDLLLQMRAPEDVDLGRYLNDNLLTIEGIKRTKTTIAFNAFA